MCHRTWVGKKKPSVFLFWLAAIEICLGLDHSKDHLMQPIISRFVSPLLKKIVDDATLHFDESMYTYIIYMYLSRFPWNHFGLHHQNLLKFVPWNLAICKVLGALKAEGLQVALSGTAHAGHAAHACHWKVMACNDSSDDESCWAKTGDRKFSNYEAMKLHHRHKGDIKYLHASLLIHEMVYTVYL